MTQIRINKWTHNSVLQITRQQQTPEHIGKWRPAIITYHWNMITKLEHSVEMSAKLFSELKLETGNLSLHHVWWLQPEGLQIGRQSITGSSMRKISEHINQQVFHTPIARQNPHQIWQLQSLRNQIGWQSAARCPSISIDSTTAMWEGWWWFVFQYALQRQE